MDGTTLETLRKESGKSIGTILREVREFAPGVAPKERSGIIHWEKQGVTDVRIIRALCHIYGKQFEVVEKAALLSLAHHTTRKNKLKSLPIEQLYS